MNIAQDIDFELARIHSVAMRMDALFTIPKTRVSLGFDTFIGLIPVVGDFFTMIPAIWMINKAHRLGASPSVLARMAGNTAIDFAIGLVPVAGDLFDALYNANIRNYRILERHLDAKTARATTVRAGKNSLSWGKQPALRQP